MREFQIKKISRHDKPNKIKKIILLGVVAFSIYWVLNIMTQLVSYTFDFTFRDLIWSLGSDIKVSNSHTNFLLAGIGGEGHEGPNLTDTIIFTSYDHRYKSVTMLSIPRDFFYQGNNYGNKINEIYPIALKIEKEDKLKALEHLSYAVEDITGKPVHYTILVDFEGFTDLIDSLGGITVDVDNSFTDHQYPTENYGWKTISFQQGIQSMTGIKALEFVRSRHGDGIEGSDFARSKRQQKIIQAIHDKIKDTTILSDPDTIRKLYETFNKYVTTDLTLTEMISLAEIGDKFDKDNMNIMTLSDAPGSYLVTPNREDQVELYNGQFVLIPITGNYKQIRKFFDAYYEYPLIHKEDLKVSLVNSTTEQNLAYNCGLSLAKYNILVGKAGNITIPLDKSFVYNVTLNQNSKHTIRLLKHIFNIDENPTIPELPATDADIVVVLGKDKACRNL